MDGGDVVQARHVQIPNHVDESLYQAGERKEDIPERILSRGVVGAMIAGPDEE